MVFEKVIQDDIVKASKQATERYVGKRNMNYV